MSDSDIAVNKKTLKAVNKAKKLKLSVTLKKYKLIYFLMIPSVIYYIIFHYVPMFGIVMAFKDVAPFEGIEGIITGEWVGFKHFKIFFNSYYFWNVLENTLTISLSKLALGFPGPIILALLLNEIKCTWFKKTTQTISYLPHFISIVVVAGLTTTMLSTTGGLANEIVKLFGKEPILFLGDPKYFRGVLVITHIWKELGWGSIIYLADISGVDNEQHEAAIIDGANKFQRILNVTLPGISSVIMIMFIFAVGGILNAGFEQVLLLYSAPVYKVGDIIDTYVYREGIVNLKYSFASAVGLFKSVIALILIVGTNYMAKKLDQQGIW